MNERIKQLAQQAGFQSYITTHEEDVAMFEKFAELIVRECAEIGFDSVNAGHNTDYLKNHVYNNILNNFGVDE